MNNLKLGKLKFLYCAPERLQGKKFINDIKHIIKGDTKKINEIVIDEAHCLSEWGHDFRFSYLNIELFPDLLKENGSEIPLIGLTATASDIVKKDIISYLKVEFIVEESSLNRPNLSLQIIQCDSPQEKPKIINNFIENDLEYILGNIATNKGITISSISHKIEGIYSQGGIIFTMYGSIGNKTSEDTISQSAEGIYRYLSEKFVDPDYCSIFTSENPASCFDVCPYCESSDIIV